MVRTNFPNHGLKITRKQIITKKLALYNPNKHTAKFITDSMVH